MAEQRKARRYDLSLPIMIRVPTEKNGPGHSGRTCNVSTQGVYFTIEQTVSPGTELDITLILPAAVTGGSEVFVHATGKAVRVEHKVEDNSRRVGLAAAIEHYDMVRSKTAES